MLVAYFILGCVSLVAAAIAMRARSLISAATALFGGNCAIALMFYMLGAPLGSVVQLSVGAGLLSVLFIIAISLTESVGGQRHED
jgi:NADH-quinone oxidoreductase subunit J